MDSNNFFIILILIKGFALSGYIYNRRNMNESYIVLELLLLLIHKTWTHCFLISAFLSSFLVCLAA
jgi:hypothetical protein